RPADAARELLSLVEARGTRAVLLDREPGARRRKRARSDRLRQVRPGAVGRALVSRAGTQLRADGAVPGGGSVVGRRADVPQRLRARARAGMLGLELPWHRAGRRSRFLERAARIRYG